MNVLTTPQTELYKDGLCFGRGHTICENEEWKACDVALAERLCQATWLPLNKQRAMYRF